MKKSSLAVAVGQRVRLLRERERFSRVKLAAEAELAPYTLSKIEDGISDPKISTLEKIAKVLKVPVTELIEDLSLGEQTRKHRKALNSLMRVASAQDEATIEMISKMVATALEMKKKPGR